MSHFDHEKSAKNHRRGGGGLRLLRVGENVRHALSSILARGEVQDDDLKGASVTVSEVRISPDLRNATIFIMPLGGDPQRLVTKALNKNAAFLRGQLSKHVTMKYLPRLKFKLDESFDEATHINTLLHDPRVKQDTKINPEGAGTDGGDDNLVDQV